MSTEPTKQPTPSKAEQPKTPPLRQIASYERRDVRNTIARLRGE